MPFRPPRSFRLAVTGAIVCTVLMMLPRSAAFAATAMAVYRGDAPAATGPGRKIELRLRSDGTMSLISDYRNNKPPITEDGHWNAISVEQIDLVIERKNGMAITPNTLHLVRQGDVLRTTPESDAQLGTRGLQLSRQMKVVAAPQAALPVAGAANATGSWRWERLVSSADKIEVDQPERYTLDLQPGGKALVRADCNHGQATYKFDGRAITIRVSAMTKAACTKGSLSERFVNSLEAAVGHRIRGDNLFIDLPGEGGTLTFVRAR
jgi:heat shock protein HslJ